ncbi:MAG: GNAT family N-acetyltransferase [Chloroflexi bacterium]|nr:GNAT family N-acetyltransferase [Chloroflexota bacterium]
MSIRPFNLPDDITVVIDLIPRCFVYPENDAWNLEPGERQAYVESWTAMRRFWPLLRVMRWLWHPARDLFQGFVWEEDGQAVGLTNTIRKGATDGWIIANVGVVPEYRRRGIARKLVEAALEDVKARGAAIITLGVISGNTPAYSLYVELGFERYTGTAQLEYTETTPPEAVPLPTDYRIADSSFFEWQPRYDLARRIKPADVQCYEPVTRFGYRVPHVAQLLRVIWPIMRTAMGVDRKQFLVYRGDQVVGSGGYAYRLREGGSNQVMLTLDPAVADAAPAIINHTLRQVHALSPGRKVGCSVPHWQGHVLAAACDAGFVREYDHDWLGMIVS